MQRIFNNLKRITRLFPGKIFLVMAVVLTVILGLFELYIFYSFRALMDSVLNQDYVYFRSIVYVFLGVIVFNTLFTYLRNRWAGAYAAGGIKVLRQKLSEKTVYLPLKEIDKRHSGDMLSRLNNDMALVQTFTTQTLINLIFNPLTAVGAMILVIILNWKLAIICTIGIPLIIGIATIASAPVAKFQRKVQEELALMNSYVQDTVTGVEVMRAFSLEETLAGKYQESLARARAFAYKATLARSILAFINIITNMAPFLICFGFGGYFVIRGEMTPGSLIAFINLLNPLAGPISQIPVLLGQLRGEMEGVNRIFAILNLEEEREGGEEFAPVKGGTVISFKNVSFQYVEEGEPVLNNLDLDVKSGEKLAIVGSSGSGKTTIIKLLLGYYSDYEGQINVYGHELQEWNLKELRNYFSLVSQDTYLFPGSIEENIAYGKLELAEAAEIVEAANAANAHDFISKFKDGYKANVGEYGDRLSGGEKQRISIARSILKQAPILLLDEATSSLDTHSEYLVQNALNNVMREGTTALIIAHRLSTIQQADRILVIDKGKVVESGKHEELLDRDGHYKRLYLRQLAQNESEQVEKEAVV